MIEELLFSDEYLVLYCNSNMVISRISKAASAVSYLAESVGQSIFDVFMITTDDIIDYGNIISNGKMFIVKNKRLHSKEVDLLFVPAYSGYRWCGEYNCLVYPKDTHEEMVAAKGKDVMMSNFFTSTRKEVVSIIHLLLPIATRMEEYELYEDKSRYLDGIVNHCYNIMRSNMQMYEYYNLANGINKFELKTVIVNEFLAEFYSSIRQLVIHAGYEIEFFSCEDIIVANIDVDRAVLSLTNIIANSCLYSPKGSKITMSLIKSKTAYTITIKDNGYGMTREVKDKAFDPFFSYDPSGINQRNGMGLAVTKKIVEFHKGRIMITSKLDEGTTISITFPVNESIDSGFSSRGLSEYKHVPMLNNGFSLIAVAFSEVFYINFL